MVVSVFLVVVAFVSEVLVTLKVVQASLYVVAFFHLSTAVCLHDVVPVTRLEAFRALKSVGQIGRF